ncbi:uncharacterized protein UBRO2_05049 [Ustilago bromivora]|uniref:PHD-type domain-containing protein n=1 Tax=Ustilago bromivora TaxID=307758 RepID=A0A8H8QRY6_9BASI|nr:uncharacterized protein UBRO2_05049 [Ustilago bromivora]
MPARRSLGAVAGPSAPAAPPVVELHPITKRLRKMWKFAAVCQFLFVFDEAFGMSGFETETLETDFENNETNVVPDLIKRLLYTLTLDRTIDLDNWQHHLRIQYSLRDEHSVSRFGTAEQPIEWAQLSLNDKVATLHDFCEWQLMDPERFRKLVKSEEDITTWRVSPIGWDAHDNAYWLFDDNRIWIQRPEPAPKAPAKAKAPAKKGTKRARLEAAAARRAASSVAKSSSAPKASGAKRGRSSDPTPSSTPSKRTRSSLADSSASTPSRPPPRRGTRTSARFAPQDDDSAANTPSNGRASRSATASYSSDSELSEPPEDMDVDEDTKHEPIDKTAKDDDNDAEMHNAEAEDDKDVEEEQDNKEEENEAEAEATEQEQEQEQEWVEFETIVVTRQEWFNFAKRFAKSKDPNEKNLHQFINNEILDQVLAAMDEIERQRQLEQALANRKRSSRIAMKESEREERERDREARARMEEKMAAIRKEEDQKRQKEEEEQEAQKSREQRLREREERLRAREIDMETKAIREEEERERREKEREERKRKREEIIANGGILPPSKESTPVQGDGSIFIDANGQPVEEEEEEWELNCEVCGKSAISPPDEDDEMVCCEQCSVWQHIKCWDAFDKQVLGLKKKRDWESVDFYCSRCRPPPAGTPVPHPSVLSKRDKASPQSNRGASNSPESPTRAAPGGNAESPRQRIKLVSNSKNAEATKAAQGVQPPKPTESTSAGLVKPPTVPSQTLRPPTAGAQPAETGNLASSGAASRPSRAPASVGQLPPPSSHAVPTRAAGSDKPTIGRPLLPPASVGSSSNNAFGDPSRADAASVTLNKPTNDSAVSGAPINGPELGMGRPTQTRQLRSVGSPRSPSSGPVPSPGTSTVGNGGATLSPRSPSYGANLGSAGYRRPSQASGSFPMRHTPAKSPLSKPYESRLQNGERPANGFSLGPARAASCLASRGAGQYASLGATAKTLDPWSAVVPAAPATPVVPVAPTALGNVAGGAFVQNIFEAPAPPNSSEAAPANASTLTESPTRPQLSSTGSDGAKGQQKEPGPLDLDAGVGSTSSQGEIRDQRRESSAAAQAFRTLEHGLSSPQPGEKKEGSSAPEVKVVELPSTHIQSP